MIFYYILDFFNSLLPVIEIPSSMLDVLYTGGQYLVNVNHYIPLLDIIACFAIYIVFWIWCATVSAVLQLL